jgi:hypothetical protein
MILVLLAGAVVLGRARLAMRVVEVGAATTVAAIAVALVLLGFALVGAPAHAGSWSAVGWIERAPAWVELGPWARDDFAAAWNWLPALAILGGLAWFIEPGAPRSAAADETSSTMWRNATAAIVLLVTLAAAAHLGALTWWRPDWAGQGGQPFERFVIEVAQAIPLPPSRIAYVESAVAGVFVVLLLGIGAAALVAVHNLVAGSLAPPAAAAKIARWPALAVLAVVVIAACLVVSRKTAGASTLVPTAMALHALLSTGLTVQACAGIGRRRLAQAVHLAMAIAAVGWAAGVVALAPQGGLFVHLCAGSGVAAALVSIVLVRAARP